MSCINKNSLNLWSSTNISFIRVLFRDLFIDHTLAKYYFAPSTSSSEVRIDGTVETLERPTVTGTTIRPMRRRIFTPA